MMKHNKGILAMFMIILSIAVFMSGCGNKSTVTLADGKVNVVTTFYPLYDFASQIGGDRVNVINLVPAGVEPHDWAPKSRDLTNMSKAQLFIYSGAGLEGWVHDFLDSLKAGSEFHTVEASKGIKFIHGVEREDAHDHDKTDSDVDPHVWVSPKSALIMAKNIRNGLVKADPANKSFYEANYEVLNKKLTDLDAAFSAALAKTAKKEIVVSHQAFGYLTRDYGLTQMPIMGLTADSEPTAQDLKKINAFVKEHQVKYIFFEELVSDKMAKTLAKDAGIKTLVLNPVEGLTDAQVKAGDNYVTIMEKNLQNLLQALQ